MKRYYSLLVIFFALIPRSELYSIDHEEAICALSNTLRQDTVIENQILYNGRVWLNKYSNVLQDQFLFSNDFLPGTVSIGRRTFKNIEIRYDIYNDEIIIPTNHGSYLQLNKEMVDSFTIIFMNKPYHFQNFRGDYGKGLNGYINVLYEGKTALYVKFQKEIMLLAVDGKFDEFYQSHRIYIVEDSLVQLIKSKRALLKLFKLYKNQTRSYIKRNRLLVSAKNPDSMVPVIEYYDSLNQ